VAPTVAKFGGGYLVDQARRWYDSEKYRELKQMRLAATVSNGFFMTGAYWIA